MTQDYEAASEATTSSRCHRCSSGGFSHCSPPVSALQADSNAPPGATASAQASASLATPMHTSYKCLSALPLQPSQEIWQDTWKVQRKILLTLRMGKIAKKEIGTLNSATVDGLKMEKKK